MSDIGSLRTQEAALMQREGLSICIPTYNRAGEIKKTLESLCQLVVPDEGLELLIVDNNSNDNTREVVESVVARFPYPLRYVFEGRQGANRARNTGIREARGRIVAFMDDDVEVAPRWANAILKAFAETNAAAIGGKTWLVYPASRPDWIRPKDEDWLSRVDLGLTRTRASHHSLCSCNLAFDRTWFDRVGGFREDLGRVGGCLLSNDETELMERIVNAGGELYYDPEPMVGHRVPPERLYRKWFLRRNYWQGRTGIRSSRLSRAAALGCAISTSVVVARRTLGVVVRTLMNGPESIEVQRRLEWLALSSGELVECLFPGHAADEPDRDAGVIGPDVSPCVKISACESVGPGR